MMPRENSKKPSMYNPSRWRKFWLWVLTRLGLYYDLKAWEGYVGSPRMWLHTYIRRPWGAWHSAAVRMWELTKDEEEKEQRRLAHLARKWG